MTVVVWVLPPPAAVMVMVREPRAALVTLAVMVEEPEPGAAMVVGLKEMVSPVSCPEAERVIGELKPPATVVVILTEPGAPLAMVMDEADAETVKLGGMGAVTVSETVVVWVRLPPVPVMVMV